MKPRAQSRGHSSEVARSGGAMRFRSANILLAGIFGAAMLLISAAARNPASSGGDASSAGQPVNIVIDYPLQGSIFPPEITPPNFLWHDSAETATRWVVEVSFAGIPIESASRRPVTISRRVNSIRKQGRASNLPQSRRLRGHGDRTRPHGRRSKRSRLNLRRSSSSTGLPPAIPTGRYLPERSPFLRPWIRLARLSFTAMFRCCCRPPTRKVPSHRCRAMPSQ